MNKEKNLIKEFKERVKELKKHNILYFNKDKPVISDAEYDDLKKQLFKIEKTNKFLKKLNLLPEKSKHNTVPIIFKNYKFIGGLRELKKII